MELFYAASLILAALAIYMSIEARWLKIEKLDFSQGEGGLKIIHLADLHISLNKIPSSKIKKVIKEENPDAILISGDYIDKPIQAPLFIAYIHSFCKGLPTFICLGNHDLHAFSRSKQGLENFIEETEALGVEVLINKAVTIEKQGKRYNILGIDDLREGKPDVEKALSGCVPGAPKICITHNPDLVLEIPGKTVDYMFCGHYHGGQIRMPFGLEFLTLRRERLHKMGIRSGCWRINGMKVYLNRGIGNVLLPMRFLSRPEILICTIPGD